MTGERENRPEGCPFFKKIKTDNPDQTIGNCWTKIVGCGGNLSLCSQPAVKDTLFFVRPTSPTTVSSQTVRNFQKLGLIAKF